MRAGDLGIRRLYVLVTQLPDTARVHQNGGWTTERELAATQTELLHGIRGDLNNLMRLQGGKQTKKQTPLQIPRPVEAQPKKTAASKWVEFARRLAAHKGG